jgi:uncharacterized membrane protein
MIEMRRTFPGMKALLLPLGLMALSAAAWGQTDNAAAPPMETKDTQAAPSLDDLGFGKDQTQADPKLQARLNKRTHMLSMHQKMGLITLAPMVASLITSGMAVGEHRNTNGTTTLTPTGRKVHAGLGIATVDLYSTTAMLALFAPKIPGTTSRGGTKLHKILAWVHGSGMIATPILGALAYQQKSHGERIHGAAKLHPLAAWTTTLAYGAAMASVSFKF